MQAVVAKAKNESEVKTIPIPSLQPGEILVKVAAVALNPTDWKSRDTPAPAGNILGCDFSGTVSEVSSGVTNVRVGDSVAGFVHGGREAGAFAEYVKILGSLVWKVPEKFDWEEAAALGGIAPDTAIQALYMRHKLAHPSKPITTKTPFLVWGGSSSVGLYAIQFAKLSGYTVVATSSPKNFELLKSLGAEAAYDHADPETPAKIAAAYPDLVLGLDTISEKHTTPLAVKALGKPDEGKIIKLLPVRPSDSVGHKTHLEMTLVYTVLGKAFDLGKHFPASPEDQKAIEEWRLYTPKLVAEGKLKANPLWRQKGGLGSIQEGMELLKAGKTSGQKISYKL